MSQNLYKLFTDNAAEAELDNFKAKLAITLVATIKARGLKQAEAAKLLNITQPRMSNLAQGKLEKFSGDFLLQKMIMLGYDIHMQFNPTNPDEPLTIQFKATLIEDN